MLIFLTGLIAGLVMIPTLRLVLNKQAATSADEMSTPAALKELLRKGNEDFKRLGLTKE